MMVRFICIVLVIFAKIALAIDSSTFILSPTTIPGSSVATENFNSANVLSCNDWIPMMGIPGATKLAWKVSGSSTTVGVAIYANGGSVQLATATATGTGILTATGLSSFTLNAGSLYRTCWCATSASTYMAASVRLAAVAFNPLALLFNHFGNHVGTAANSCSSGVPPATTGALTTSPATDNFMVVLISKE